MSVIAQIRIRNAEHMAARFHEQATVYFLQCDCPNGYIKIGWAEEPERRLPLLQVGCPYPLSILATMPGGYADEQELHERFKDARVHGEWFEPTLDLIAFINALPPKAYERSG